jgi:hypothetical protein
MLQGIIMLAKLESAIWQESSFPFKSVKRVDKEFRSPRFGWRRELARATQGSEAS